MLAPSTQMTANLLTPARVMPGATWRAMLAPSPPAARSGPCPGSARRRVGAADLAAQVTGAGDEATAGQP
ncbi:MAG TPA: hypothetical protein VF933_11500, partial [Streptosporangiaceae bacterium]